jgi:hypothetical protein
MLISIAYTLATFQGASLQPLPVTDYICRPTAAGRSTDATALFGWDCTLPIGVNLSKIGRI